MLEALVSLLEGQIKIEEMCFSPFLKIAKGSAARIELGRSFLRWPRELNALQLQKTHANIKSTSK